MEISKKTFLFTIVLSVLMSSAFSYVIIRPIGYRATGPKANVFVIYETARGTWTEPVGNLITDLGERYVRNIIGWDNVTSNNATHWIALGNNTAPANGDTKLDAEATATGFTRAANDTCVHWMNGTDYAYNVSNQFTATGTIRVNATSLHWNPTSDSDNNCFALASITETTFNNNDNCTIVWVITWDANS